MCKSYTHHIWQCRDKIRQAKASGEPHSFGPGGNWSSKAGGGKGIVGNWGRRGNSGWQSNNNNYNNNYNSGYGKGGKYQNYNNNYCGRYGSSNGNGWNKVGKGQGGGPKSAPQKPPQSQPTPIPSSSSHATSSNQDMAKPRPSNRAALEFLWEGRSSQAEIYPPNLTQQQISYR